MAIDRKTFFIHRFSKGGKITHSTEWKCHHFRCTFTVCTSFWIRRHRCERYGRKYFFIIEAKRRQTSKSTTISLAVAFCAREISLACFFFIFFFFSPALFKAKRCSLISMRNNRYDRLSPGKNFQLTRKDQLTSVRNKEHAFSSWGKKIRTRVKKKGDDVCISRYYRPELHCLDARRTFPRKTRVSVLC